MEPHQTKPKPRYASVPGVDAYVDWVLGAGRAHYFRPGRQQDWLSVLVRLRGIGVRDFARGGRVIQDPKRRAAWQASIHIPKFYIKRNAGADGETYCTAFVRQQFFDFLLEERKLQKFVRQVTLSLPLDTRSIPFAEVKKKPPRSARA